MTSAGGVPRTTEERTVCGECGATFPVAVFRDGKRHYEVAPTGCEGLLTRVPHTTEERTQR